MRWRPRFKTRVIMIVVAVVAVAIGAEMTRRRWEDYRERATWYRILEVSWSTWVARWKQRAAEYRGYVERTKKEAEHASTERGDGPEDDVVSATQAYLFASERAEDCQRQVDYFGRLKTKYERAAWRPWLLVEPDPPAPVLRGPSSFESPSTPATPAGSKPPSG